MKYFKQRNDLIRTLLEKDNWLLYKKRHQRWTKLKARDKLKD